MSKKLLLPLLSLLVLAACGGREPIFTGEPPWIAYGPVQTSGAVAANGVAAFRKLPKGFVANIQVNIEQAPSGAAYHVWIGDEQGKKQDIGVLQTPSNDARHGLSYTTEENIQSYNRVFIVRQKIGEKDGETVATASLKIPTSPEK